MLQKNSNWLSKTPKNIIVRMPNWLGDAVMATPVLEDLRNQWKDAKITAMCQLNIEPLLKHNPNINEIYSYKKPSGWIHSQHPYQIIEHLKKGRYDLGILLTNSFSSAWWFWSGNVQNRIGYTKNLRSFLLNKAVPFPPNLETQHLVITYKMLLEPLGIPISNTPPNLYLTAEEIDTAKNLLNRLGAAPGKNIIVGINPGAAYGSAKCWLPERFKEITNRLLANPHVFIVFFGDRAGAPLVNDICKGMPDRVVDLAGKTNLRELMALINCCSIFLTNDSGPMHIAAALGTRLIALFGSTNEVKTGPYPSGKVIHKHVECSPCYKRICPIDFRCMTRITVDEVYNELQKLIQKI